jgi:hypothetical protein
MADLRRGRNFHILWLLVLLAIAYMAIFSYGRLWLASYPRLNGSIGVLLGLYICSRPAANLVDFLFFGRYRERTAPSRRDDLLWLALNLLVMLAGWLVIVTGATRFTA